jgi:hypothetical protein
MTLCRFSHQQAPLPACGKIDRLQDTSFVPPQSYSVLLPFSGVSIKVPTETVPIPPPMATRVRHTAQSPTYSTESAPISPINVLASIRFT